MDTLGRTTLKLTAMNLVDDARDTELIVRFPLLPLYISPPPYPNLSPLKTIPGRIRISNLIHLQVTYTYPLTSALRKPLTIFLGIMSVFVTAWGINMIDTSIGK